MIERSRRGCIRRACGVRQAHGSSSRADEDPVDYVVTVVILEVGTHRRTFS
jgi:hypothetical protein